MKRVLVTGGSGFIGRRALAPLRAQGFDVHAVDLKEPPTELAGAATWHQANLLSPESARRVVEEVRPTHLLHLAWYAVHRLFWSSPENLRWTAASLELVRAFREGGGERAVLAGTCVEYDTDHGWCSEATTPLVPRTLYGASKDALRRVVAAYAAETGLSWAWGRIFSPYGPHEHPERLVPAVTLSVLRGEPTRCTHGRQVRDFMHVDDVAAAFAATLDATIEGPLNIASGEPRSIRELVTAIAEASGAPQLARFGDVPAPGGDPPFLVADVRRLTESVGFERKLPLEEGIRQVATWWRESGATR